MSAQSHVHPFIPILGILALPWIFGCGCVHIRQTDPARTATEQLLLSTAADRAAGSIGLSEFAHKKVFLDGTYFEGYDSKYALGAIRDALSQAGALLVGDAKDSEIIVEARSGALSTDYENHLVGVPQMALPIPLAGSVSIPEISFYKSDKQYSTAKFALLAYGAQSREHVFSSGPLIGRAYDKYYKILFFGRHRTDVPEKRGVPKHQYKEPPKK
jgi:hypothetical protein